MLHKLAFSSSPSVAGWDSRIQDIAASYTITLIQMSVAGPDSPNARTEFTCEFMHDMTIMMSVVLRLYNVHYLELTRS